MIDRKTARLIALAGLLIFISTIMVLLARQFNLAPERPSPAFRTFGPESAKVSIYEYTDFACPACRHAALTVEELMKVYGPAIRISFKHYPLSGIHPWSADAAAYADCAGEQGKFREYGALLFENQEKWGQAKSAPPEFADYARKLGLDWTRMQACAASPEARRRVALDVSEADLRGVNATPTFFVNGKRAVGPGQLLEQARNFDNLLKGGKQ
mgnify:CR=1 FL=1